MAAAPLPLGTVLSRAQVEAIVRGAVPNPKVARDLKGLAADGTMRAWDMGSEVFSCVLSGATTGHDDFDGGYIRFALADGAQSERFAADAFRATAARHATNNATNEQPNFPLRVYLTGLAAMGQHSAVILEW